MGPMSKTNASAPKPLLSARQSFGWEWASRLPRDGAAAEGIYSALRSGYFTLPARPDLARMSPRETSPETLDKRVATVVEEQTQAWGTVRSFRRLSPAQVRILSIASEIKVVADLESDAFRVIDGATGVA